MLVRDRDIAGAYLEAWLGAISDASVSAESFYRLGPSARPGLLPPANQGITLAGNSVYESARRIVAARGLELLRSFGTTCGVAVSLKIRDAEVHRNEPCITFYVPEKLPDDELGARRIPREIEGVVTDVVEAGIPELHSQRQVTCEGADCDQLNPAHQ